MTSLKVTILVLAENTVMSVAIDSGVDVAMAERLDEEVRGLEGARKMLLAEVGAVLLRMKRGRSFMAFGFATLADYAGARLDYGAWKTRDLVELAERCESLPRVREVFASGEVAWTKLRAIARVATVETEAEWVERARVLSCRQLERMIADEGGRVEKVRVVLELTEEEAADLEDAVRAYRRGTREKMSREHAVVELVKRGVGAAAADGAGHVSIPPFRTVIHQCDTCASVTRETRTGPVAVEPTTVARATCDAEVVDARQSTRVSKTIPPRTRRRVLARDRDRCVVPGCSGRDFVEVHHVHPRALGGDHTPELLATLCTRHHAMVHEGLLRIDGEAPRLRFFSADGRELRAPAHVSDERGAGLSKAASAMLALLADGPLDIDALIERTGLAAERALGAATELGLAGLVARAPRSGVLVAA